MAISLVLPRRTAMESPPYAHVELKLACPACAESRCCGILSHSWAMPARRKLMPLNLSTLHKCPMGKMQHAARIRVRNVAVKSALIWDRILAAKQVVARQGEAHAPDVPDLLRNHPGLRY